MKRPKRKIREIELSRIDISGEVNRIDIDDEKVRELSVSIGEVGLLQPILLRPDGERFEIVAGYRRYLALKLLKYDVVDAVVMSMSDQDAAIVRATENLARENLTPMEEAIIFGNLIDKYEMTYDDVAKKFGYGSGTVRRRMDLLKMPAVLKEAVHNGKINVSVAEELWPISDEGDLNYYLTFAVEGGCTSATARGWCKDWRDVKRREKEGTGKGGVVSSPHEPRPIYVTCDICNGPMVLGEEKVFRACGDCFKRIEGAF